MKVHLSDLFEISTSNQGNAVLQRLDDGTRYSQCGRTKSGIHWRCNKYCGSTVLTDINMLFIIAAKLKHHCQPQSRGNQKPPTSSQGVMTHSHSIKAPTQPPSQQQAMVSFNSQPTSNSIQVQFQQSSQLPKQEVKSVLPTQSQAFGGNTLDYYFIKASKQPQSQSSQPPQGADANSTTPVKNDPSQPQDLDPREESKSGAKRHSSTQVCFGDVDPLLSQRSLQCDALGHPCLAGLSVGSLRQIQKVMSKHKVLQPLAPIRHPSTPVNMRDPVCPNLKPPTDSSSKQSAFTLTLHPLAAGSNPTMKQYF